mmetsp:Transcript_70158/g.162247  ORF Transcript_70158/g.162247 Transcript_70158/m.162247 type:complete len:220 (+) Transcript_70158:851-1510(+)
MELCPEGGEPSGHCQVATVSEEVHGDQCPRLDVEGGYLEALHGRAFGEQFLPVLLLGNLDCLLLRQPSVLKLEVWRILADDKVHGGASHEAHQPSNVCLEHAKCLQCKGQSQCHQAWGQVANATVHSKHIALHVCLAPIRRLACANTEYSSAAASQHPAKQQQRVHRAFHLLELLVCVVHNTRQAHQAKNGHAKEEKDGLLSAIVIHHGTERHTQQRAS